MVATTFLQILPLFPTPITTSFPLDLTDFEIALTAFASPSWAILSVSYKSSRAVRASLSVLMTCKAVFKAPWFVAFSTDPASDIAVDEFDDAGVNGRWNIEVLAITDRRPWWKCVTGIGITLLVSHPHPLEEVGCVLG